MNQPAHQFASDNYSGICSEALDYLQAANVGDAPAYGNDEWTHVVADKFRELFETDCEVFFVFNGTAANSLSLSALCQSYHSVICHETAHLETDECGGPEFASNGSKLLLARGDLGKLDPASVQTLIRAADKEKLPTALKGATETMRDLFFSNMSERAAKIMKEDMAAMGPVRLKDVDQAQMAMVQVAKDLAAKGEIMLVGQGGDDELIY